MLNQLGLSSDGPLMLPLAFAIGYAMAMLLDVLSPAQAVEEHSDVHQCSGYLFGILAGFAAAAGILFHDIVVIDFAVGCFGFAVCSLVKAAR